MLQFDDLITLCHKRNIIIIEDASESLGSFYKKGNYTNCHTGTIGKLGCFSFNGNKIITTGGGGMIVTDDASIAAKAKYLTTQAKDDPVRYVHNEVGYNFRLTNIQAAMGVAQLEQLSKFLLRKREIFQQYQKNINKTKGFSIADAPNYATNNHWLNVIKIDENVSGVNRDYLLDLLNKKKIQARPVWFLNHLQKPFKRFQAYKINLANHLYESSFCIPSGTNILNSEIRKVINTINRVHI